MITFHQVADMLLDGKVLEFYKWESEVKELLQATRDTINEASCTTFYYM